MTVPPPDLDLRPRPDLHALIDEHWPSRFPLLDDLAIACSCCTPAHDGPGVVSWPCAPLASAIAG